MYYPNIYDPVFNNNDWVWPYYSPHHYYPVETETPEQLRRRADELERKERAEQAEDRKMIEKLKNKGFVIIYPNTLDLTTLPTVQELPTNKEHIMTEKERFKVRLQKMIDEDGLVDIHFTPAEGADTNSEEFWAEVNRVQDLIDAGQHWTLKFGDSKRPTTELKDL